MHDRRFWIGLAAVLLASPPLVASDAGRKGLDPAQATRDARALAATIDRMLAAKWASAGITPVGPADDVVEALTRALG